jgi:hypothetical protein
VAHTGLVHDGHAQCRLGLLQVDGRPQTGEAGADDRDVALVVARQDGAGGGAGTVSRQ